MRIGIFKTKLLLAVISALISVTSWAQTSNAFSTALDTASTEIGSVVDSVAQLMLYVGGVVGVVGAIRIYLKWNNGDQDVTKAIVGWGGACLFLVLSGGVIKLVFGITGAGA